MAIAAEILTHLRAEAGQFKAEIASAEKATEGFAGSTDRMAAIGKASLLAFGAIATVVGVAGVKAAMEQEAATALLTQAIKNAGGTYDQYSSAISKAESHAISLGFADEELDNGLTKLVNSTKDVNKSVDLMSLAEDIARGRHIDLGAATDILVKVEAGRVGLLGRLGISTTDVTGATISQEEAVRRLTATYGGQASAYTETFAGKIEVLKAKFDEILETIGGALIPVITDLGGAIADTLQWFSQNQEVAIALAVAIGGPLVAAIGVYIGEAITAAVTTGALGTVIGATSGFIFETLLPAIGSLIAWLGSLTIAEAAATFGLSFIVVGAAALFFALTKLGGGVSDFVKSADKQTDMFIKSATATGTYSEKMGKLQQQLDSHRASIAATLPVLQAAQDQYNTVGASTGGLADKIATLSDGLRYHQRAADDVTAAMKKLTAEHEKGVAKAAEVAVVYGVTIPAGMATSQAAVKAISSQLPAVIDMFGTFGAQILLNAGVAGDALKALVKDTTNFANTLEGSINKATDPFSKFGSAVAVSEGEMEQFFVGSQQQAATWADEITGLINRGVNLGIINQMAQAGPGSKPALDAFVAMVDEHGVDWVNSVAASGQQAAKATEDAYNTMAGIAAVKSAEMALVTTAATKALSGQGTADLVALANSSDTNLSRMAVSAIFHIGEINGAIFSIPSNVPVNINITSSGVDVAELKRQLGDIPGRYVADIVINSHGEADPLGYLRG